MTIVIFYLVHPPFKCNNYIDNKGILSINILGVIILDIAEWIDKNLKPEACTSDKFIYNHMESQSCYSLPVIYIPFESKDRLHWADRGCLYDFLYSIDGAGKRILDFGPGDGWPSLIIAPFAKEVIGLDSSQKRVEVCTQNAKRLNISNARFVSYVPGTNIPFGNNSFDGIVVSSSIEQTPDPREILKELYRVLKPGGKLRIFYEALNEYKDGEENDIWINPVDDDSCILIMYFRNIEEEYADQYALTLNIDRESLVKMLSADGNPVFKNITIPFLEGLSSYITSTRVCRTIHPSGRTYASWMKEAGFKEVHPTHSGRETARMLYDIYTNSKLPGDMKSVDELIKPVVKVAINLEAPIHTDPMITAIK